MDENVKIYRFNLSNGMIIYNVIQNVDIWISSMPIDQTDELLEYIDVYVRNEENEYEKIMRYENAKIKLEGSYPNVAQYRFTVNEIPKEDLRYAQTRSDIEYLAMMTETEL